jgi:hypothetical protein
MPHYRAEIEVPMGPSRAFRTLADFSNARFWDPGVVAAEALTPGPPGVGSTFRLTTTFLGREAVLDYTVTEFVEDHTVCFEGENRFVRSRDTLSFDGDDSRCAIVYQATLQPRGLAVLAAPLLSLAFARLGRAAESGLDSWLHGLADEPTDFAEQRDVGR